MRHFAAPALLAAILLAGCAERSPLAVAQEVEDPSYEAVSRSYADAIAEGMMRARVDRLRRAVRRMGFPELERPPG
jgi:hypothetical protein